ncbi:MAG: glutamate--tRNA ligase [Oscillospiraceae bacterium]|nr:glutamate--tRNA ligase [Oscillospiraceae bacterium]
MDRQELAERLFPGVSETPQEIMDRYPPRKLPEGAAVTRIAPSPTGFMHLGNLYGAITDERIAHRSGGVFMLRIEDTDAKRAVEGGVQKIIEVFDRFGLNFDEGALADGETGAYGPYRQRQRERIYKVFAKALFLAGRAYPCFATEEELEAIRQEQAAKNENPGYYGKYAVWRDAPAERIAEALDAGREYVIRYRSEGDPAQKAVCTDLIRGRLEVPQNDSDLVLLKSDGIPTYHFAHVVDDTLMGTTHVVRGEEWLATLPYHLDMFRTMRELFGWKTPKYLHTAHMLKMEDGHKRKLSKRKDPELALDFYRSGGYPERALIEYLMTILNSNYEEWRAANPDADWRDFPFSVKKMSSSGALFDMEKLRDVSKNVISRMTADEVLAGVLGWSAEFDPELHALLDADRDYARAIFAIGRGGAKPRKDLVTWADARGYLDFFYDGLFRPVYALPACADGAAAAAILRDYAGAFDPADDRDGWFARVKSLAARFGFAPETKLWKQDPAAYRGHVGDVSMILRSALTGRTNSPDLYDVCSLLGADRVRARLSAAADALSEN